jgi:hypothetical protein
MDERGNPKRSFSRTRLPIQGTRLKNFRKLIVEAEQSQGQSYLALRYPAFLH